MPYHMIFKNVSGLSRVMKSRKKETVSKLPWNSYCFVKVELPPEKIWSVDQPILVNHLKNDWGLTLSSLNCSSGGFGTALNQPYKINMGHIWAEIFSLCFDSVSVRLGYGHVEFDERFSLEKETPDFTIYKIRLFYSERLPEEFSGLEYLVSGYLNDAFYEEPIFNQRFDIRARLDQFVQYRSIFLPFEAGA